MIGYQQTVKQPKSSVLLVDDDQMVRTVAIMMLENLGFTVLAATNGSQAIDLYQQHQKEIVLVFCDLVMPGLDGWQTLAALRAINPAVPTILVSGFDRDGAMGGRSPDHPQVYLKKPYDLDVLRKVIVQVLGTGAVHG